MGRERREASVATIVRSRYPVPTVPSRSRASYGPTCGALKRLRPGREQPLAAAQQPFPTSTPILRMLHTSYSMRQTTYMAGLSPELPEDLYLLREDRTLLLGSIIHEKEAWLELDDAEFQAAVDVAPGLREIVTLVEPR